MGRLLPFALAGLILGACQSAARAPLPAEPADPAAARSPAVPPAPVLAPEMPAEEAASSGSRGTAALDARQYAAALPWLDRAVDADPEDREIRLNRALALFGLRRFAEASADFERILRVPVDPGLLTDYDLARQEYEARVRAGEIDVPLPEAIQRRLLPVDRAAMFARWYGRIAALLARGPGFATEYRAETTHFAVRTDDSEALARLTAGYLELALSEYAGLFPPEPAAEGKEKFQVTIFARREDYVAWLSELLNDRATAHLSGGSYHPLFRELILTKAADLDRTLLVLLHEGFHQYLDSLVSAVPSWFGEGLADYFGASRMGNGFLEPGQPHPLRRDALRRAMETCSLADLRAVLQADAETFMAARTADFRRRTAAVGRNYALSFAFAHFLVEGGGGEYREILVRYYRAVREGAGTGEAYSSVLAPFLTDARWEEFAEYARRLAERVET